MAAPKLKHERIRAVRVAEMTGLSVRQVQVMALTGRIPGAAKFGDLWTFDPVAVERWIRAKENEVVCQNQTSSSVATRGTRASRSKDVTYDRAYEQALRPSHAKS